MNIVSHISRLAGRIGLLNEEKRIAKRVLLFFVVFLLIPIIIIIIIYFQISVNIIEKEVSQLALRSLKQTKSNLEYRLMGVAEISQGIMSTLYPYLNRSIETDSLSQQIDDLSILNNVIDSYDNRNMIAKIRLYVDAHKIFSRQRDRFFKVEDVSKQDFEKFYENFNNGRNVVWLETYLRENDITHEKAITLSCVSLLRSIDSYDRFSGILYTDILEADICDILEIGVGYDESVFLTNPQGIILSHKNKELLGKCAFSPEDMQIIRQMQNGVIELKSSAGTQIVSYTKLTYPDWYMVASIPKKVVFGRGSRSFYLISLLSFSLILIIMILFSFILFSIILENTIARVNNTVKRLNVHGMELLGESPPKYEKGNILSTLESNVDNLIFSLKNLIEESCRVKISQRDAQLKALQAQINPHFLYNTLDMIKWMILDSDNELGVRMINSLSRYFRLSLNAGHDIVPIADEYNLILSYLDIQKKRFNNGFVVNFDIDEKTYNYLIPKLSIQPFVENSLLHGINNKMDGSGVINISIKLFDDIFIKITDNGTGISSETIDRILHNNKNDSSYGVANVNERIELFCGQGYGVNISSSTGVGTEVTIRIKPIQSQNTII